MYCTVPHNSLVVQPNGNLSICCAARGTWSFGHISEVTDVAELWSNHEELADLRNDKESLVNKVCGSCLENAKNGMKNSWYHANTNGTSERVKIKTDKTIRFLEFTTSNLCNQTCVTCSSYFSSKWMALEQEATEMSLDLEDWKTPGDSGFDDFGAPLYRMPEEDVEKLFPLLPNLEQIVVKGGEPFADNNNYRILEELLRVNEKCSIHMTTNMSKVPQKYIDLLSNNPNLVHISVSMDGVDETYEWVRSTPFEQTIENIKNWRSSGINGTVNINHRMNIFNLWNYNDVLEYWNENLEGNMTFSQEGWVNNPKYASVGSILTEAEIDNWNKNYKKYPKKLNPKMKIKNEAFLRKPNNFTKKHYNNWRNRMYMFALFMNFKREINIFDVHPKLKELTENWEQEKTPDANKG